MLRGKSNRGVFKAMEEICQKCGLPKNLCVCIEIAKETEKIKIRVDRRRFGKVVTTVTGLGSEIDDIAKKLKKYLACGGTSKNNEIELQGNHREKVKGFLLKNGYKQELIDV